MFMSYSMKNKTEAVLTNISYILAGIASYLYSPGLLAFAVSLVILGFASGIHHYYLTPFTKRLDYIGMYMVFVSIMTVFFQVYPPLGIAIVVVGALGFNWLAGADEIIVGAGVFIGLVLLAIKAGLGPMLEVSAFISVAYVFNHLGDNALKGNHSIIHGLGWHNMTAYALYVCGVYLI
jgi:hypothetical protein